MLLVNNKKIMTENRPFLWKISILGSFNLLGAVKDINIFENSFQLFESPYKKAAIGCPAISMVQFLGIHSTLMESALGKHCNNETNQVLSISDAHQSTSI